MEIMIIIVAAAVLAYMVLVKNKNVNEIISLGTDEGNNVYEQTKPFIQAFGQNMRSHFPCKYMPKEHIFMKDADGAVYKLTISTSGEIVVSKLTNS